MSNYISAVTQALPTPVASPIVPQHAAPKAALKTVPDEQDAQVTFSPAALAFSHNETPASITGVSSSNGSLTSAAGVATNSPQATSKAGEPAPQVTKTPVKYVDPETAREEEAATQVKLSTAAQVISMTQTGSSVDEIAAVLGMSVADVSSELGVSSAVVASAQSSAGIAVHA